MTFTSSVRSCLSQRHRDRTKRLTFSVQSHPTSHVCIQRYNASRAPAQVAALGDRMPLHKVSEARFGLRADGSMTG
jgi:DNA-binding IclR family transcriptional regulator